MRRFISTLPGRVVIHFMAVALILPYLSLALANRADAQLATLQSWAVLEFENLSKKAGAFGKAATEAVHNELAKAARVDTVPQETIQRSMADLGQLPPLKTKTDILRLGQEVRASSVVTGSVVDWRVTQSGGGKNGEVILQVVVTDVASGLPANGALVQGQSTTRAGDVADETLINEALNSAAAQAVLTINSQTLPTGTVLNTVGSEALINQGERTGFKVGQEVVVLRGRQQVATGVIADTDPDSSNMRITKFILGTQPGDKVRAIFPVPQPKTGAAAWGQPGGQPNTDRKSVV